VSPEADLFRTTYVAHLQAGEYEVEDITGCVTCECDGKWWFACMLQVDGSEIQ
jgi:hypothetical protein